ncbi:GapS6a family protein [Methylovulum miyakonense]|uniref:GapS6a family protein n=1 Tax=Methylovulum miyakonense TaxID=645578 RepID=UPI000377E037|nr:hypothetical protein [Methylovulum miyakonense]
MEILNAEFLTSTVLSGITYDIIKCGAMLGVDDLKQRLRGWVISDIELAAMTYELNKLELTDEMSETAIERKITASAELNQLIENIKPSSESNTIIQHHSGSGDNVGRDKIIHRGK